jgi:hypothetical protein
VFFLTSHSPPVVSEIVSVLDVEFQLLSKKSVSRGRPKNEFIDLCVLDPVFSNITIPTNEKSNVVGPFNLKLISRKYYQLLLNLSVLFLSRPSVEVFNYLLCLEFSLFGSKNCVIPHPPTTTTTLTLNNESSSLCLMNRPTFESVDDINKLYLDVVEYSPYCSYVYPIISNNNNKCMNRDINNTGRGYRLRDEDNIYIDLCEPVA